MTMNDPTSVSVTAEAATVVVVMDDNNVVTENHNGDTEDDRNRHRKHHDHHHHHSPPETSAVHPPTTTTTNFVVTQDVEKDGAVRIMKHSNNNNHTNHLTVQQPLSILVPSRTNHEPHHPHRRHYRVRRRQRPVISDDGDHVDHHPSEDEHEEEEDDADMNHQHNNKHHPSSLPEHRNPPSLPVQLTEQDVALCQALDMEYDRAIEERQIAWTSRYQSVRQSTVVSIVFMILFICIGTIFFVHQASIDNTYWSVSEGLLFSIYTITTVGYGHLDMPNTVLFQWYIIIYIFVGIATLTILVAQIYQCVALETNRVAVHANDVTSASARQQRSFTARTTTKMRQWVQYEQQQRKGGNHTGTPTTTHNADGNVGTSTSTEGVDSLSYSLDHPDNGGNGGGGNHIHSMSDYPPSHNHTIDWVDVVAYLIQLYDVTISFLRENEYGRSISVLLPFVLLITIGAAVIGPIEGWTITESIYFSVVSLTTVGFGDYYPTKNSSIWFCCIWLPFSVGFMSLYLGNVAAFYIRLSDRNIARIENILRKRIQSIKEKAQLERRAILRRALRGQQQQHLDTNDHNSNDGGSSIDDDLVLSMHMDEGRMDHVNGNDTSSPNRTNSASQLPSKRMRLSSKRLFGFNTIPTDDRLDSDVRDGGGESAASDDMFNRDSNSVHSLNNSIYSSTAANTSQRRERILRDSMKHMEFARSDGNASMTMSTMKDVLHSIHQNNMILPKHQNVDNAATDALSMDAPSNSIAMRANNSHQQKFQPAGPESEYLSVRSNRTVLQLGSNTVRKKPSFALRALVQERFAEIIATDIAGYQNSIEIKDCTLTVTIEVLKKVADKWLIPRRARKAFRAVSFEALYFVGEHGLITKGAEALFSLSPIEFHQIFSPLLASFGDAESMESWLESTQALADVDLSTSFETQSNLPLHSSILPSGLKVPPKASVESTPKDFNRSQSLPATVSIPSQPIEIDELPEIA